jgi:hypothetical protein
MEVYITKKDWDKIINYSKFASDKWGTEIGGMAVTIQDNDGDWIIQDPTIIKQEVSAALCELDKTELAAYYSKMAIKYKKKDMRFCWWHSHAKMGAFWSGTDTNTIDEYEDGDLSFALVVNVNEEYKCRVSVWKPFTMHKDVDLIITNQKYEKYTIPKAIQRECAEMCTQPERTWYNSGKTYNGGVQQKLWGETTKEEKERAFVGQAWYQLVEKVDEINTAFIAGEYQYDKYAKKITDLNRRIKKAKLPLKVDLIAQGTFEDLLSVHPWELIECEVGYEECDPSDSFIEMLDHNYSYGGTGYLNGKN